MARIPRKYLIDEREPGVYHCVNRCVRRAVLCGKDPLTGKNHEHRKEWIRDRLELLAGIFAIDVGWYTVMSNHLHLVLRNRPDIVKQWSDEEVARRWWRLHPQRKNPDGTAARPTRQELDMLMSDPRQMRVYRRRLSSISWLMKCLCEKIARMANKEDGCTGRFWQGRFGVQKLLDDAAILACGVYVDLNPIRAGIAKTPETSPYTSAYDRIGDLQGRHGGRGDNASLPSSQLRSAAVPSSRSGWLVPIQLRPGQERGSARRASNKGLLPISLRSYLNLLDWTGRQICRGKQGAIPSELAPIFERTGMASASSGWLELVQEFGRRFHRAVGHRFRLEQEAERRGKKWFHGVRNAQVSFG